VTITDEFLVNGAAGTAANVNDGVPADVNLP
jgi:hypothetical protein